MNSLYESKTQVLSNALAKCEFTVMQSNHINDLINQSQSLRNHAEKQHAFGTKISENMVGLRVASKNISAARSIIETQVHQERDEAVRERCKNWLKEFNATFTDSTGIAFFELYGQRIAEEIERSETATAMAAAVVENLEWILQQTLTEECNELSEFEVLLSRINIFFDYLASKTDETIPMTEYRLLSDVIGAYARKELGMFDAFVMKLFGPEEEITGHIASNLFSLVNAALVRSANCGFQANSTISASLCGYIVHNLIPLLSLTNQPIKVALERSGILFSILSFAKDKASFDKHFSIVVDAIAELNVLKTVCRQITASLRDYILSDFGHVVRFTMTEVDFLLIDGPREEFCDFIDGLIGQLKELGVPAAIETAVFDEVVVAIYKLFEAPVLSRYYTLFCALQLERDLAYCFSTFAQRLDRLCFNTTITDNL
ncbi:hypothetical protein PCE1_003661 [Barthelona sp. PCE]